MVYAADKFINNPNDAATDVIKGLVDTYPGLQYLFGFAIPKVTVVIQAGVSDKVAVISGGGYGHEPAHAGYVGEGMLTAAICGDVFASPSVDSIVAGIRAVTGSQGCLLIVKNYTADRLNFGLAAEQAKYEGYKVETVIVGEDCALPPPRGFAGRRGLAGTILVYKVAGAAAAAGLSLEEVAAEAKCASEMVGTMGVAFSLCKLLGPVTSDRLGQKKMELGLGIHGEPGAAVVDVQPVDVVVSLLLQKILSPETNYVPITRGDRVVLMANGYNLLCKAAYAELKKANIDEEVTPRDWSEALKASIASVRKYGGATEGYRTMLDALIPASQVLEENLSAGVDPVTAFSVSAAAATKGAKSTIQMQAQAGRSSYVSAENLATVPDPGAMAAAVWYRAAARAVRKKQHLKPYEGSVVPKSPTVPSRDRVFYFDFPDIGRHTCRDPTFVKILGAVEVTPSGGSPRSTVGQSESLSCNLGASVSVREWGIIRFKKNGENKTFVARQGCRITVPFGGIVTYCNSIEEISHHSGFWWNPYLLSYYSIPPQGIVEFLRTPDKTKGGYQ
ncbi:unnamed protein product [Brassica napus]|uniref:(rape) hypothetical protein n=1 Tax=Brassica napus TaxID=3708 RepID=A0A816L8T2_BRANA|nr:unnamed protein product [Brassica napus]